MDAHLHILAYRSLIENLTAVVGYDLVDALQFVRFYKECERLSRRQHAET
ncbi:MAG: hypothetical protein ACQET7_00505 [Thermodesulfobacteriota bacterium]